LATWDEHPLELSVDCGEQKAPLRRSNATRQTLFTTDTHFVVYMNAKDPKPSQDLHSREVLASVFADLNRYDASTHFVGQSTIFTLSGDRATGEAYGNCRLMIAALRYRES
jgi:hypothetical protein